MVFLSYLSVIGDVSKVGVADNTANGVRRLESRMGRMYGVDLSVEDKSIWK
jgi:hypothetical protein